MANSFIPRLRRVNECKASVWGFETARPFDSLAYQAGWLCRRSVQRSRVIGVGQRREETKQRTVLDSVVAPPRLNGACFQDRKSTRLNSSHANISYAVFCLKKKNINTKEAEEGFS